jgi:hypothetical protein
LREGASPPSPLLVAGDNHTVALRADGTLWVCGWNHFGQVGDGTNVDRNAPVQVGTDTNWLSVSAGYGYTMAIKKDGTLWAWGLNQDGQLGNGTNTTSYAPVPIGGWPVPGRQRRYSTSREARASPLGPAARSRHSN